MSLFTSLGSLFDPDDQAAIAARGQNITDTVRPNSSYWQAGDFGQAGQNILKGGQGILDHNVGANFGPMQAFQSGLASLGQQAGGLYQSGGPEAAAALAAAQANTANAGGGLGGLKTLAGQSAANTAKVGSIDTTERGQFANEATQNTAAAAASKLQQTIIQAALNHANRSKNTQATAIRAQEGIDQSNINNALQSGANSAQNAVAMGGISNQQNQQALGLSAAEGILAAGGGAAAYGASQTNPAEAPGVAMTGDDQSLNYTGGAIADLPQNVADPANIPNQTAYGPAVETPEDAWYAALTKAQSQDQSAYQAYGA
jgi:hypothetical protein